MSRRLAVDVGSVRVGLAISEGSLALPMESLAADEATVSRILEIAEQKSVQVVYVGLPLNLRGDHTPSTRKCIDFARKLSESGLTVRMIDERLTTKSAQQMLQKTGKKVKESRGYIDAQAAALILDFALQSERSEYAGIALDDLNER
ncbi:MAG: Holliday junction resolvase RuvX [Actinomycetota bacterium]